MYVTLSAPLHHRFLEEEDGSPLLLLENHTLLGFLPKHEHERKSTSDVSTVFFAGIQDHSVILEHIMCD